MTHAAAHEGSSDLTAVRHDTATVEGLSIFYREAGDRAIRRSSCCTAFPRRRSCSAISCRDWPTDFI